MNLRNFTPLQKQALLDLAVLAMYADGHLAIAEDERIRRLINEMGYKTELECNEQYDAAISRVSQHTFTVAAAREHAALLAETFADPKQRERISKFLNDLMACDKQISPAEDQFLETVGFAERAF